MPEVAPPHVMVIIGTRPEALKLAPVVLALRADPESFRVTVLSTGQHREMLAQALASFGVVPDHDLAVMQPDQTLAGLTAALLTALQAAIEAHRPDLVLVQGDTTSAFAGALAAFYARVSVGHVEAGLRTGERYNPFPEELNRKLLTSLASIHFAPTDRAARALRRENVPASAIHVTGNTIVDALERLSPAAASAASAATLDLVRQSAGRLVLVTCHRRESLGADLEAIVEAVAILARRFPDRAFFFPVHLNPRVRSQVLPRLSGIPNITLTDPVPYADLLHTLANSELVITDSGGIQEEAPSFGVPTLVLRRTTERPEAIRAGFALLVPPDTDAVVRLASHWLKTGRRAALARKPNPYGDGRAAERIAEVLRHWTP